MDSFRGPCGTHRLIIALLAVVVLILLFMLSHKSSAAATTAAAKDKYGVDDDRRRLRYGVEAPRPREPSLGDRLKGAGWVLYHTPGCGFCVRQLELLGGKDARVPMVNCEERRDQCAGVGSFPTWRNSKSGAQRVGYQDKRQLMEMAATGR